MSSPTPAPYRAHLLAFVVPMVAAFGVVAACAESPRANGESCLKNQDCLSGNCSQLTCAAAPPLLGAEVDAEAGPATPVDAHAQDSSQPGNDSAAADDSSSDDGSSESGPTDGATDGRSEGGDAGPKDAAKDTGASDAKHG